MKTKTQIKIIKGDLILKEDTLIKTSLKVEGNIRGYYNLTVLGDIDAMDIDAMDINAWNIDAWNIDAWNIDAMDINARNINAMDINARNINARNINARNIICEKRIKKPETSKTRARIFIQDKSKLEFKEW